MIIKNGFYLKEADKNKSFKTKKAYLIIDFCYLGILEFIAIGIISDILTLDHYNKPSLWKTDVSMLG